MAKSIRIPKATLGDVYCVTINAAQKGYFQYVADDSTQLHSNVVQVFRARYLIAEQPPLSEVAQSATEFFSHVILKIGLRNKYWEYVGNTAFSPPVNVLFRNSGDYGNPKVLSSSDWWVWKIGNPAKRIGVLKGDHRNAYIGLVVPPDSLVYRMRNGTYDFIYPQMSS